MIFGTLRRKTLTMLVALTCVVGIGALGLHIVCAAPPAAPQDPPPDAQDNDNHRPPPRPHLEDVLREMNLTNDQQQKVDAITADFHEKEHRLREDLLRRLKDVLTAGQLEKLGSALDPGPPPLDADRRGNGPSPATQPAADDSPAGTVIFSGGHELDPRDGGRPDILIAAALNVPTDVFRTAFSGVTPASNGNEPEPAQVRLNKQALLKVLGPYRVTNDRLDEVSNHYRYQRSQGQMWPTTPARAAAVIVNGEVTSIDLQDAGFGYSSPPVVTVAGYPNLHPAVTLAFGTDFKTNGSVKEIRLAK